MFAVNLSGSGNELAIDIKDFRVLLFNMIHPYEMHAICSTEFFQEEAGQNNWEFL